MPQHVDRHLVRLTGDEVQSLPAEVREEIFDWARANGIDPTDTTERPVACITVDPAGQESHVYVTEIEMDPESQYLTHLRHVPLVEPLPEHLVHHWTPTSGPF